MHVRKSAAIALAATAATVGAAMVSTTPAQAAATPAPYHVVTIHVNSHRVLVGKNNTIHSGRTLFRVVTHQGGHLVNIVRFRKGYSIAQFGQDINKAFSGDVAAINRVDAGSVFNGGSETNPRQMGEFSANLRPGRYWFLDQNSRAIVPVKVVGKMVPNTAIPTRGLIDLFTYGFGPQGSIPHSGRTLIANRADQPHFIEFQQVKPGTTALQVKRFIKHGAQGQPSWALKASWGSGVLSPRQTSALSLNLPKGEYLVACFWPDFKTGMPHMMMGMWKLITLT